VILVLDLKMPQNIHSIFVMEERHVFSNIGAFKDWCRASVHRPTEFFNSNLQKWPHTLHPFGKSIQVLLFMFCPLSGIIWYKH